MINQLCKSPSSWKHESHVSHSQARSIGHVLLHLSMERTAAQLLRPLANISSDLMRLYRKIRVTKGRFRIYRSSWWLNAHRDQVLWTHSVGNRHGWCAQLSCPNVRAMFICRLPYCYGNTHLPHVMSLKYQDTEKIMVNLSHTSHGWKVRSIHNMSKATYRLSAPWMPSPMTLELEGLLFRDVNLCHQQLEEMRTNG